MKDRSATVQAKPSALERFDEVVGPVRGRCLVLFLDYDGTLTPIVRHPELAELSSDTRGLLRRLSLRCTMAVVSGRDLADLTPKVAVEGIFYAGSHGFELAGPGGWRRQAGGAGRFLSALDSAGRELREAIAATQGAWIERKRYGLAVHYREVSLEDVPGIEGIVADVARRHPQLRRALGKKVFELQPRVDWDKGAAVKLLLQELRLDGGGTLPVYIGDDVTDEDGFRAVADAGIGIAVQDEPQPTSAHYSLRSPDEVAQFLEALLFELD